MDEEGRGGGVEGDREGPCLWESGGWDRVLGRVLGKAVVAAGGAVWGDRHV